MSANWIPYMRQGEESPWSCMVDVQYRSQSGDPDRPALTLCHVRMRDPGPHGVGTEEEVKRLDRMFDAVQSRLSRLGAAFVARTRDGGHMNFAIYTASENAGPTERLLLGAFSGEAVEFDQSDDPAWAVYRELLPKPGEERWVLDLQVVQALQSRGDPLTPKRDVRHFVYFPTQAAAQSFADELQTDGFKVELGSRAGARLPFSVMASRDDSVTIDAISPITADLSERAAARGGEYDGWEAMLVRTGAQSSPKTGLLAKLFRKKTN